MFSDAVVNPNAMVVEVLHTSVALLTVLACLLAVAVAELTKIMIYYYFIYLFFLIFSPFVLIHHSISRVRTGNHRCAHDHGHCGKGISSKQKPIAYDVMNADIVDDNVRQNYYVREELGEGRRLGKCVGGMIGCGIIGRWLIVINFLHFLFLF